MSATDSLIIGFWLGGVLVGGACGVLGWMLGYGFALRRVTARMRARAREVPIDASWGGR